MTDTPRSYPPAIICIGRNYAAHAKEMGGGDGAKHPTVFMKNPAALIGDGEPIVLPPICYEPGEQVDYEGELAFVIGRDCRDADESNALSFVRGYAIANDVSARWWQKKGSGGQFVRGKSFDTFCPLSPVIPAAEVADPADLRLTTRLNDEIVQDARTSEMLFSIPTLIAALSSGTTLLAGTVVLTGTPEGVGAAKSPPRWLRDGDVIEIEIEGLGVLRNPVERG